MYVIAGVTGHTGSVVASTLLAARHPVRVIVRDPAQGEAWRARGAEVAVASLDDRPALARALAGATGAYLLLPPPPWTIEGLAAERARLSTAILGAVADARPGHVVFLSSIGAERATGTGMIKYVHPIEQGLRASSVPSTFLRAGFFMDNWTALLPGAVASGALHYAWPASTPAPQVATADIGRTAARLLAEGPPADGARIVELAGPADLDFDATAAAISRAAGTPIRAVSVPPAAVGEALAGMGASPDLVAGYVELLTALNAGDLAWTGRDLQRGTTTLEQRAAELLAR